MMAELSLMAGRESTGVVRRAGDENSSDSTCSRTLGRCGFGPREAQSSNVSKSRQLVAQLKHRVQLDQASMTFHYG